MMAGACWPGRAALRSRLWTRNARAVTRHFEQITVAVARLSVESVLIDGEAVIFRADGHSDFQALTSRGGGMEAVMVPFDLLHHEGEDIRRQPIESRRDQLARVAGQAHLMFSQAIDGDGPEILPERTGGHVEKDKVFRL